MAKGLVYLRPQRIAFVHVDGPVGEAAEEAWQRLLEWSERSGVRREVGIGYGIAFKPASDAPNARCGYRAGVEIPNGGFAGLGDQLPTCQLPGGAYARNRHVGRATGLAAAFNDLNEQHSPMPGLVLDDGRPLVEVYLDDPLCSDAEQIRTDLLLPLVFKTSQRVA